MAKGHSYFRLVGINISPDNNLVAFALDTIGRRQYTLHVKDLKYGKILKDKLENCTGGSTWANDNKTLFYTQKNKTT